MIEAKRFSGVLNTDDKPENVAGSQHIDAKNVRFYGGPNGLTAENIKGNYIVTNNDLPAGSNECIGSFFDSVNQRIFWFNYNSNGDNGIYKLDLKTEVVSPVFICNTDSATDILNFDPDYPVHSCNIVYRTAGDGDLLYWTDGYNRPKYLNIDTVSSLAPFTEDMINAAKNAPLTPPDLQYQTDTNVNVNNLRKKLFRASYRWVYKNGEKSTFSPISKMPLPTIGYDPNASNNPNVDNNIEIQVIGGGDDYQAIEVAGQFNINNVWGDFFLIDKLDRDQYNISPNATYNYYFYNDGVYTPIDPQETDLYYSWLPDKANTLELLNGNVLIYGGITDGYNTLQRDEVDVTVTVGVGNSNTPTISYTKTNNYSIIVNIGPIVTTGVTYTVFFDYDYNSPSPGYNKNVTYTTPGGVPNQDTVVNGLSALLTGGNIVCTDLGGGLLLVTVDTGTNRSISNISVSTSAVGATTPNSSWKWSCPGRLGLVYFDERGKTNGVISYVSENTLDTTDFAFNTPNFSVSSNIPQVPIVSASINHTPPTWATSYQWVRANLLPTSFLYWITCDYQNDTDYMYFCIENLNVQKAKNTGFVPSYEFTEGDRIRVIAAYTGGNYVPYNIQLDMEVLGTVQRQMASPASLGTFVKTFKPTNVPSSPYQTQMLIELYSPRQRQSNETQFFYEWGEKYNIYTSSGNRYHRGQLEDQTSTQPATFQWFDGDVYFFGRKMFATGSATSPQILVYIMDPNQNDYFPSAVNSNGRGWIIDPNAKEEYNSILVRWGGKYQSGTNINELSIFRPNDFDEVDRSKGAIRKLKSRDRILRVFQDRGTGQYGVYMRFIQNNQGQSELVTTNEIITTNNIQYYQGVYGVSGYPTNLVSTQNADYFVDVVTGRAIRLGGNGLTDLGLAYKGQFYLSQLALPYNKSITRTGGYTSKVMGFFNYFDNQYNVVLQGSDSIDPYNFSFNETRNAFCSFYDFHPEWAMGANDMIYTWKNGELWKHDNNTYCNFYGTQYGAHVTTVFNNNLLVKKSWNSINEIASSTWSVPLMYTNTKSYGSQRQESSLVDAEFVVLEGNPSSAIKRDANSPGGKINGDFMKGNYLVAKFEKQNASNYITLSEVSARITESPLTAK